MPQSSVNPTENFQVLPHNVRPAIVWNAGGADYDAISRTTADAIEHAVIRLDPQPGERVLDVATGTGWASRRVARRGATIVGIGIAESLIVAARAQAAFHGIDAKYHVGDAEDLPFTDGEFDAVISTFGVMFVSRPEVAAAELARVCKRGGRLALLTWLPDSTIFGIYEVMKPFMPPPPAPPPPSPFEWGRKDRIVELLGDAFDLRFEQGETHLRAPGGEAVWDLFSTGSGPAKTIASSLDETRWEEFRRTFIAFHEQYRTDLGIDMPRQYLLTIGVRR